MFYCWYWLFTYLQLGAHRWVKFRFWQTLTYMIFYLDGAPRRRDTTLTCRPHPSMED